MGRMNCICFPLLQFFSQPSENMINPLSTIIQLEKTIIQLDRYSVVVSDVVSELKQKILSSTIPNWKKRLLLHRRKMMVGRRDDILAQKERLFNLLMAIQKSVHLQMTIESIELANKELRRLHIDNIESTINQMDEAISIQEEQNAILAHSGFVEIDTDIELERELLSLAEQDISLPSCPIKEPVAYFEKTRKCTAV